MRQEKQSLTKEYVARLNSAPFFIVVNYTGLKVGPLGELRKRLAKAGAELHVVKNSIFRIAAQETGVADLGGPLTGQLAVVTGQKDISVAAKAIKTFASEFDKPKLKFGFLNNVRLAEAQLLALADLPSLDVLRGKLLGVLNAPATQLVVLLNTPATQLVRVIRAKSEQAESEPAKPAEPAADLILSPPPVVAG
jgi:large subunit ribosomal protein L10